MKKHSFDYPVILKYLLLFFTFLIFNNLEKDTLPYSIAILSAALTLKYSIFTSSTLLLFSFVFTNNFSLLPSAGISVAVLSVTFLIYKRFNSKPKYELPLITLLSMIGFLIIGKINENITLEKKVLVCLISLAISIIVFISGKTASEKGLKVKPSYAEIISIATFCVLFGIGVSNFISPYFWKGITVFLILCSCYLLRFGLGTFISAVFGISLAVYYGDLEYVAITLLLGMFADIFSGISRYLSALALIFTDFLISSIFGVYNGYAFVDFIPVLIGCLLFSLIPNKPFKALKEKLYSFREKQLVRQAINRNRTMTSNRLYELSSVFNEMSIAFNTFKERGLNEEKAKENLIKQLKTSVCQNCEKYKECKKEENNVYTDLTKLIDVGFAKGKLSVIDLTKNFTASCIKQSDILFGTNKMLSEYRVNMQSAMNLATGRELISEETLGISEILRGLALESGTLLKYQSRLERKLGDTLLKNGFNASEVLIYGEGEETSVSMVLSMKEFSVKDLIKTVTKCVGIPLTVAEKNNVTEDKFYLLLKKNCDFDAVFGIAKAKKDGSNISGDTHSVIRITDDKFLVAISDGMGSGEKAEEFSSVSLSLIESFYKAGMKSELILNTVNKLLSVNTEDSFSALDVSIIDLKNKTVDFIKYGSPYGYVINDGGVKIVEGNSLPIGILKELKPSVCTTEILDGDMIVLTSDGISDAFETSSSLIEYIRRLPALNPQTLCEQILQKAISLSSGIKKDDMTVLAVRVYKKDLTA